MIKLKILISGLGGSLFPYLHNSLKDRFELYYVDSNPSLKKLYSEYNFFESPLVTDTSYVTHIKKIIDKKNIDFYIPLIDEELIIAKEQIENYNNVKIICPNSDFLNICLNKYDLMLLLSQNKISFIESYKGSDFNSQLQLPIFVKPISGRGSRGIRKIDSAKQLEAYYTLEEYSPNQVLVQPLLLGIEYTVGVLCNNRNQIISISSKRIIQKKGITQIAVTENNSLINSLVIEIVKQLNPRGPFNVQLILTPENELKIFEINPRFSTTSILEIEGGIDLIDLYMEYYNKDFISTIKYPKERLVIHRRWESVFYNEQ